MKITFMPDTYTIEELKVPKLHDRTYCIFDLEGTGINPAEDSVTQFGTMYYKKGESLDSHSLHLYVPLNRFQKRWRSLRGFQMKRLVIPEMYLTAPIGGERPDE
ncbi:MAG TPA: hypothetical protein DEF35_08725 [Paenibacillus sp.]|nr:hypothetical protein [Paenibacillus sp.]OZQ62232.1 hypothetical protein CA599_26655 [Paenibacillus taichungensis]HBU81708.1 hypothetical protein [Paenibacillus sp.]